MTAETTCQFEKFLLKASDRRASGYLTHAGPSSSLRLAVRRRPIGDGAAFAAPGAVPAPYTAHGAV